MATLIGFYIDNRHYSTDKAVQPVKDILALAGLSADRLSLISPDGSKYDDAKQHIEIKSGNRFTTEKRDRDSKPGTSVKIQYKVNGEQLTAPDATLTVKQILQDAGKAASIDLQDLNSYILENIGTGEKYESLDDIVKILNDDEFLAIHSGATPVALPPTL